MPVLLMKAAQSAAEADGLRPVKQEPQPTSKIQQQQRNGNVNANANSNGNGNGANKNALAMAAAQAQLVAQQRQQQQQQQQRKSSSSSKKKGQQLRRGKWTPEEESYANRLIQEFKAGLLPLTDGTTLRTFLSKLLNCDPMRISKKFVGSNCIGKQVFRRRTADLNRLTPEQIQKSRAELSELERRFLERVAQTNRVKNSSAVGGGAGAHQNTHMHNQNLHNQHRQHMASGGGVNQQHHNAVVSAALSAAAAANVPMHHRGGMNGGNGGNFMNGNRNVMHQNPPWMQPPMGYKQGLGAQMARDNLAAGGQSNSRTAAAGRALLEGLSGGSGGGGGNRMGSGNHSNNNRNGGNDGGNGMPHGSSGMMAMAELQRRASMQMPPFGNQSAQNLLAALSAGGNSNQSLVQMARNASAARMAGGNGAGSNLNAGGGSYNNLMMKSGFSREQLSQLARDRGLSSASLSNMASGLDGHKNSFDQLMSLDFQSLQSIDNLANLIQTGAGPGGQAPSSGMKNWSADQNGAQGGHMNGHGGNRLGSTVSLSNAARRLASQNNFESLMRNLSSNNNISRTGLSNDDYGNGGGNSGGGSSNNNNNGGNGGISQSNANLQSLLQSMNSSGGGNTSMSSLLGGNNASAASLANLLRDNSSTGLSALRNSDGLNGRNTTSVEDFLSLVATGDIPHQDPAVLNLPLSQLQQQQNNNGNNNNNNGGHHGGDGGNGPQHNNNNINNNNNNNMGGTSNSDAAANILAQATGNSALANALASRSFGSNLGSFADMSRAAGPSLSSLGSTAELLQQLAEHGGSSNSLTNMKRKLLDVDGGLESQGLSKRR